MSYTFVVDGEKFTGTTAPNSVLIKIHHPKRKHIASFIPESGSLFSDNASGAWTAIHPSTSLRLLEKIQPQVVAACKQHIEKMRAHH